MNQILCADGQCWDGTGSSVQVRLDPRAGNGGRSKGWPQVTVSRLARRLSGNHHQLPSPTPGIGEPFPQLGKQRAALEERHTAILPS